MKTKILELSFKGPAHFGSPSVGVEKTETWLHSDSLFGAVACAWADLHGDDSLKKLLEAFPEEGSDQKPPFRISSAFPYLRLIETDFALRFYPKPFSSPAMDDSSPLSASDMKAKPDAEMRRLRWIDATNKKAQWIPEPYFLAWLNGLKEISGKDFALLERFYPDSNLNEKIKSLLHVEERHFRRSLLPRASLDRINKSSNLFHVGLLHFTRDETMESGLFALIQAPEEPSDFWEKLDAALLWLGESGIGGERSSGCGRFRHRLLEFPCANLLGESSDASADDSEGRCLLSLCALTCENARLCRDERARYVLLERGGWVGSRATSNAARRKSARFLAEGSLLPGTPNGKLYDVTPARLESEPFPHPVYAYGFPLSVKAKIPVTSEGTCP